MRRKLLTAEAEISRKWKILILSSNRLFLFSTDMLSVNR